MWLKLCTYVYSFCKYNIRTECNSKINKKIPQNKANMSTGEILTKSRSDKLVGGGGGLDLCGRLQQSVIPVAQCVKQEQSGKD